MWILSAIMFGLFGFMLFGHNQVVVLDDGFDGDYDNGDGDCYVDDTCEDETDEAP